MIDGRRRRACDDLVTRFVSAEVDGHRLSNEDILDIWFLFLIAGLDTVTATLTCSVAYLAEQPGAPRGARRRPVAVPAAVEELLRWETPVPRRRPGARQRRRDRRRDRTRPATR